MLFAGFEVSDGRFTMPEIVLAGVLGNLVGSWIAWGIGWYGRVELLEKHGKWLHITPKHIAWADRWFERYGAPTVFFSRMLPVIRTFISLPAGVARMPFWKFTLLSVAGIIPWVLGFGLVGNAVGDRWDEWQKKPPLRRLRDRRGDRRGIVYLLLRRRRGGRRRAGGPRGGYHELGVDRPATGRGGGARRDTGTHGLLPVSSSGHLVLVPSMLGWRYRDLDPDLRKSFEVALHAGGALALLIGLRREVRRTCARSASTTSSTWRCRLRRPRWPHWRSRTRSSGVCRSRAGRGRAHRGRRGDGGGRRLPGGAGREVRRRGRAGDRPRAGVCADARRVAQRRHPVCRTLAALPARGRKRHLTPDRPTRNHGRRRAEGSATHTPGDPAGVATGCWPAPGRHSPRRWPRCG